MAREYDVMAAGHLCLDIIPRMYDNGVRQIGEVLRPGKLLNVAEATIGTGGPVSNTGMAMMKLGSRVVFCARCGDDDFGRMTIDVLKRNGNADGIHIAKGAASSYTIVIAPPGIDRIFMHNPGTNDSFTSDDLDTSLISRSRHFHFGYPSLMQRMFEDEGEELRKVFLLAKQAGATTSLDFTLPDPESISGQVPWKTILAKTLPYVDIFVPSIEECYFMLHREEFMEMKRAHQNAELIDFMAPSQYSALASECLEMGSKMVTLKSGHRGFYFRTAASEKFAGLGDARPTDEQNWAGRELWAEALVINKIASAAGSGDCAIAGLLTGFLRGLPIEKALRCATIVGFQNLHAFDTVSGVRSWEETLEMLDEPRPCIDARLGETGWRYGPSERLWFGPNDKRSGACV